MVAKVANAIRPLQGVLDHRTFSRVRVDLGRCEICGEGEDCVSVTGGAGGDLRELSRPAGAGVERKGRGAVSPIVPHARGGERTYEFSWVDFASRRIIQPDLLFTRLSSAFSCSRGARIETIICLTGN